MNISTRCWVEKSRSGIIGEADRSGDAHASNIAKRGAADFVELQSETNLAQPPPKGFLIVTDGDTDPLGQFTYACEQLAAIGLPVPENPFEIVHQDGGMRTGVIVLPHAGTEGGLETLLLSCCDGVPQEAKDCVESFYQCSGADGLSKLVQDKVRLRSLIAILHPDDPSLALSYWLADDHRPFDLIHCALDEISDCLAAFANG